MQFNSILFLSKFTEHSRSFPAVCQGEHPQYCGQGGNITHMRIGGLHKENVKNQGGYDESHSLNLGQICKRFHLMKNLLFEDEEPTLGTTPRIQGTLLLEIFYYVALIWENNMGNLSVQYSNYKSWKIHCWTCPSNSRPSETSKLKLAPSTGQHSSANTVGKLAYNAQSYR